MFWLRLLMNPQVGGAASSRSYFADLDLENSRVTGDFSLEIRFHNKKYKNDMIAKWLSATPEFLYAYDKSGERFEAPVLGKRFSEHWYNPRAIGNGPYRFVEFVPGTHLVLEKGPWFPLGGNAFDKLVFKVVKDQVQHPLMLMKSAAAQSEKENDGVHVTSLSPQSFRQVMKKTEKNTPFHDGSIQHSYFWSYGYSYIGWNADKAFFADKRVRRAMGLSLKAEEILTKSGLDLGNESQDQSLPGCLITMKHCRHSHTILSKLARCSMPPVGAIQMGMASEINVSMVDDSNLNSHSISLQTLCIRTQQKSSKSLFGKSV